jgi:SAM-dependent methyltransferase
MTRAATKSTDRDERLIRRANELYHELQAGAFDALHRRRHRVERLFWLRQVAPRLGEFGPGARCVDLCTGTGFVPRVLLGEAGLRVRMLCVDLSAAALEAVRRRLGQAAGDLETHAGSATDIPREDASVDAVTLNAGLHHVPDWPAVLAEVDRVLRPGGRFCLGHEPNEAFFSSRLLRGCERIIWNGFWYLSPARNLGRLARRLDRSRGRPTWHEHEHLTEISDRLREEGLIDRPLSVDELRRLIDPHTHDDEGEHPAGFDVPKLLDGHLAGYAVEVLRFTDYGGQMLQAHPWLRGLYDWKMRVFFPGRGRLFSCIVRKPPAGGSSAGRPGDATAGAA